MITLLTEIKQRERRFCRPPVRGFTPIHDEAQWTDEQMGTAQYVGRIIWSLERGGTLTESSLGTGQEGRILTRRKQQQDRQEKQELNQQRADQWQAQVQAKYAKEDLERARKRAERIAMEARFPAWEKSMMASRGLWSHNGISPDRKNLLLLRQDSGDSMTGLYIRVQDRLVDAGIYRGGEPYLGGAYFESFWSQTFCSAEDATSFVLRRAMGENRP